MEERLKRFALVIDYGSFTEAARRLHTSQPALTTAVQKLERELKSSLFTHRARHLELTPVGQLAYEQGKQLLLMEADLRQGIGILQRQKQPFALGCIDSVAAELVRDNGLQPLEQWYELSLTVQNSQTLLTQLKRGQLDLAIAVHQTKIDGPFASRSLGNEKFVLAAAAASAKAARSDIKKGILSNFLAYNQGSTTFALLNEQLQAGGLTPEPRFYSTNPAVLQEVALKDRGVAALPHKQIEGILQDGTLEIIELKRRLSRPITAYWQRGRRLPAGTSDFLAQLSHTIEY